MTRALLTLAVLGGSALLLLAMLRGWRRRGLGQGDLPPLPRPPAGDPEALLPPVEGLYVGTTLAGRWLDRVVVHGLSDRAAGELVLGLDGLRIEREGAPTLYIPSDAVRDARVDAALSGTVVGGGGLLVVTWEHGEELLDSGFRADDRDAHPAYAKVLRRLADAPPAAETRPPQPVDPVPPAAVPAVPVPAVPVPAVPVPAATVPLVAPLEPVTDPSAWTGPPEPAYGPLADPDEVVFSVGPPPGRGEDTSSAPFAAAPVDLPTVTDTDVFSWGPLPVSWSDDSPLPTRGGAPALVGLARPPAVLALEDGRLFSGTAYGARGSTFGEAVFNTGMTGYQETLTDPSYHRQVVVMTAPHVGNTGVNDEDPESARIWVAGYVVRDPSRVASNWRARRSLDDELVAQGVVGISGLDTRALTRHLRERGAMRVGIASDGTDVDTLLDQVLASPTMAGSDLARDVSTAEAYVVRPDGTPRYRVAALDLGLKRATPARMAALGCEVHVLPAGSTAAELLAVEPDGVFFSNGPGDPATCDYAVEAMRGVLDEGIATFGICFGNQILGRALGLGTYKLDYGHRGVNQPVLDRATGRVAVTSHNHGFAVAAPLDRRVDTPYGEVEVSHVGLNDSVVEGLRCHDVPAFSVQYHPEAAPGPHDANGLFDQFCALMDETRVS